MLHEVIELQSIFLNKSGFSLKVLDLFQKPFLIC